MKLKTFIFLFIFATSFLNAQENIKGDNFDFEKNYEEHPQIVLADNYNHYLFTVTGRTGMQASYKIILRKFDQKNNLIETFSKNYAIDILTLHNFHGAYEISNSKIAFLIESYSNKRKVNELIKYEFDKTTGQFTSSVLLSHNSTEDTKFGYYSVTKSQNNKFIGIVYEPKSKKKEPEVTDCLIVNSTTFEVVLKKTVSFEDEFHTDEKIVSNTGNFIYLRKPRSWKETNYFVEISNKGENKKTIEENTRVQKPIAISIGTQDYLLAFNYKDKGIRRGDFGSIFLYDVTNGTILKNNEIEDFNKTKDIQDVYIRNVFVENNEIRVFVEGKYKSGTKPSTTFPNSKMTDPVFNFGPVHLLVFSKDGTLTKNIPLEVNNQAEPDFYRSFGLLNIKGDYVMHTGTYYKGSMLYNWLYKINPNTNYSISNFRYNYTIIDNVNYKFVNQIIHYFPDTNKVLVAAVDKNDNKMGLLSFTLE